MKKLQVKVVAFIDAVLARVTPGFERVDELDDDQRPTLSGAYRESGDVGSASILSFSVGDLIYRDKTLTDGSKNFAFALVPPVPETLSKIGT